MAPTQTRQWILQNPPAREVVLSGQEFQRTFALQTTDLPTLETDQVLIKTLYLSNDPAQRTWIQKNADPERLYAPPVLKGEMVKAYGISEVVVSKVDSLKSGQLVIGATGWTEYAVANSNEVRPIAVDESAGIRATSFLGALGATGLTAYYGLVDIARATAEDTIVVSGAAGATGSMVVQIAKHIVGCKRIIGIAGGPKKCAWVKSLGADECVDYKSASFKHDILKATEGYVEVYFDNVGGEILNLMLTRVKKYGRVAACGAVATYNRQDGTAQGITNWGQIIMNRIEIKGFIITDAIASGKVGPWMQNLIKAAKEQKIKIGPETETVVPTKFDAIPNTWVTLFKGANQGKLVTAIEG